MLDSVRTFFTEFITKLVLAIYGGILDWVDGWLEIYNMAMNGALDFARDTVVSGTGAGAMSTAMQWVQAICRNVFTPLAAIILSFFFCWQLISMMQEGNRFQNIKAETMIFLMLKLGLCLLAVSKSWEIVNGFFDASSWAAGRIGSMMSTGYTPQSMTTELLGLPVYTESDDYLEIFKSVFTGIGIGITTMLATIAIMGLSVYIKIICYVWVFEFLMYAAGSPIPFSTFINREWGQMGTNYLRKMLSLAFQGVFMLLSLTIYSVVSTALITGGSGQTGSLSNLVASVMSALAIAIVLKKSGTISDSVFNAH